MIRPLLEKSRAIGTGIFLIGMGIGLTNGLSATSPVALGASVQSDSVPAALGDEGELSSFIYLPMLVTSTQMDVFQDEDNVNAQPNIPQDEVEAEVAVGSYQVEPGVFYQNQSKGHAADIATLTAETGLPQPAVEGAIAFQQAFAQYADTLLARYPDQISSIRTESLPQQRGHIQFVKDVPAEVLADMTQRSQLVSASAVQSKTALTSENMMLTGGGEISMAQHITPFKTGCTSAGRSGVSKCGYVF